MEHIQSHSFSIIFWLIVAVLSYRHLYVNWKVFRLSYRNVLFVCIPTSLLLLLLSAFWSEVGFKAFFGVSIISSYIKQYKSRLERTSLKQEVNDKHLLMRFPIQKRESNFVFRLRVYLWHFVNDSLAFSFVVIFGSIVDHYEVIFELLRNIV